MRATIATFLILSIAAMTATTSEPDPAQTGFLFRTIRVKGREYKYAIYIPRDYEAARRWPAVVFLNGAGECGTDGQKQIAVGLGPAIMLHTDRWPAIVIFPQKPVTNDAWEDYDEVVQAMLDAAEREWSIDRQREYLTGLSQGGHGTWAMASLHPDRFAAIVPVCGYGDPLQINDKVARIPAWIFHGEADHVVPVEQSRAMAAALKKRGGDPRLTVYADVEHNSWERAYAEEELPKWLFTQRSEH